MPDEALTNWLAAGSPISGEATAERRRVVFSQRFFAALAQEDLGTTQELHDAAVAQCVLAIHDELRAFGIEEYDAVWSTLPAPTRAAIKRYVSTAKVWEATA